MTGGSGVPSVDFPGNTQDSDTTAVSKNQEKESSNSNLKSLEEDTLRKSRLNTKRLGGSPRRVGGSPGRLGGSPGRYRASLHRSWGSPRRRSASYEMLSERIEPIRETGGKIGGQNIQSLVRRFEKGNEYEDRGAAFSPSSFFTTVANSPETKDARPTRMTKSCLDVSDFDVTPGRGRFTSNELLSEKTETTTESQIRLRGRSIQDLVRRFELGEDTQFKKDEGKTFSSPQPLRLSKRIQTDEQQPRKTRITKPCPDVRYCNNQGKLNLAFEGSIKVQSSYKQLV